MPEQRDSDIKARQPAGRAPWEGSGVDIAVAADLALGIAMRQQRQQTSELASVKADVELNGDIVAPLMLWP